MMVADADEDFIDVDMASAGTNDEESSFAHITTSSAHNASDSASRAGMFVPFYIHLGGADFDDE